MNARDRTQPAARSYAGKGHDYTIRLHGPDGRLVRLIRHPGTERAITDVDREQATCRRPPPDSTALAQMPGPLREMALERAARAHEDAAAAMAATGFTTRPAFAAITADGAGRLCVVSREVDTTVFDVTTGRVLGTARLSSASVAADRVAVVRHDSVLGFPKVLVYRIVEAPTGRVDPRGFSRQRIDPAGPQDNGSGGSDVLPTRDFG